MKSRTYNRRYARRRGGAVAVLSRINTFTINVMLIILMAVLFVGYLVMNNRAATKGFTIKAMEQELAELEETRGKLDLQVVSLQSMRNIEDNVDTLGFVPVAHVEYLSAASAVAVK